MLKKIIYSFILLFCFLSVVKAEGKNISDGGCQYTYLYLHHVGVDRSHCKKDVINFYNMFTTKKKASSITGAYGQAFCFKPGATSDFNNGQHTCVREINPENSSSLNRQAFDVAITRAYQLMIANKYISNTESSGNATSSARRRSSLIGTMAFRWIASRYGYLESIGDNDYKFNIFSYKSRNSTTYWYQDTSEVKAALSLVKDAVKYGDYILKGKKTYQQLVDAGVIWTDEWISTINSVTGPDDKNNVVLNVTIAPKNPVKAPSVVNWGSFKFETKNDNNKLVSSSLVSSNKNRSGTFNITIQKTKGKWNEKYNLAKVTVSYGDRRNPNAHIMIYKPTNHASYQKFILVKNYSKTFQIQREIPFEPTTSCVCEADDSNNYTGRYILYTTTNGVTTSAIVDNTDPNFATYNCPPCSDTEDYECERIVNPDGTVTYYGKDTDDGSSNIVDQATYKSQCLHICETPSDNEEGLYYCADPGTDNSGRVCNGQEYIEECYCTPRKEKCTTNPSDPDCAEYEEKCPNCRASSSIPSSCNDFDVNSSVKGYFYDINPTKTSCNSSANNVKMCVLGKNDMSGESFEATKLMNGNRYCKVYCDENYQFTVPTARYSTSGGYFTLNAAITGTRNCYTASADDPTEGINSTEFINEISALNVDLLRYWNEWSKWRACLAGTGSDPASDEDKKYTCANYLQITDASHSNVVSGEQVEMSKNEIIDQESKSRSLYERTNTNIQLYVSNYQACSNWVNMPDSDLNFNPAINFNYDDYGYDTRAGTFKMVGDPSVSSSVNYCVGNINSQYNCIGTSYSTPPMTGSIYQYISCNESTCTWNSFGINLANWIQKTVTKSGNFTPGQNFNTYHQYGTVKTGSVCTGTGYNSCLWTRLPDNALPVELKTGKGAFKFVLSFANIGQSNIDNSLGRLIGRSNSVLNAYVTSDVAQCENPRGIFEQEAGYVCAYVNNCDSCSVGCEGDSCSIHETCEGDCPVSCKTCIFDGENTTYKFRTVSLNNLFPNSCETNSVNCRKEGYNWQSGLLKASVTKKEIQDNGNDVYETPEYSYLVTASQLMAIRQYNKDVGTYENTTLADGTNAYKCENINYNGLDYSVKCVSAFLNENTGKYFTQLARNASGFKLWTETDYCPLGNCLSRTDGIGPSWK